MKAYIIVYNNTSDVINRVVYGSVGHAETSLKGLGYKKFTNSYWSHPKTLKQVTIEFCEMRF